MLFMLCHAPPGPCHARPRLLCCALLWLGVNHLYGQQTLRVQTTTTRITVEYRLVLVNSCFFSLLAANWEAGVYYFCGSERSRKVTLESVWAHQTRLLIRCDPSNSLRSAICAHTQREASAVEYHGGISQQWQLHSTT